MANDIMQIDPTGTGALAVPEHLANAFGDDSNMEPGGNPTPQLSVRGKLFRIVKDGEETVLTRRNADTQEDEPISMLNLVVVNQGARGARAYYKDNYDSGTSAPPTCFSLDGKVPSLESVEKQAASCAECPHAVKGSRMTQSGHATTSCTLQRRLAVLPAGQLDFDPLLLRLAPTSAWDKNNQANEANGWFAWHQYCDFLRARGVQHTAQVVTKVKFDNTEYPKVLFKADRFIDQNEVAKIKPITDSAEVQDILYGAGRDRGSADDVPKAQPAPETTNAFGGGVDSTAQPQPQESAPQAAPQPAPEPQPQQQAAPQPAPQPQQQAKPAQQAEVAEDLGSGLDDLMAGWE